MAHQNVPRMLKTLLRAPDTTHWDERQDVGFSKVQVQVSKRKASKSQTSCRALTSDIMRFDEACYLSDFVQLLGVEKPQSLPWKSWANWVGHKRSVDNLPIWVCQQAQKHVMKLQIRFFHSKIFPTSQISIFSHHFISVSHNPPRFFAKPKPI